MFLALDEIEFTTEQFRLIDVGRRLLVQGDEIADYEVPVTGSLAMDFHEVSRGQAVAIDEENEIILVEPAAQQGAEAVVADLCPSWFLVLRSQDLDDVHACIPGNGFKHLADGRVVGIAGHGQRGGRDGLLGESEEGSSEVSIRVRRNDDMHPGRGHNRVLPHSRLTWKRKPRSTPCTLTRFIS